MFKKKLFPFAKDLYKFGTIMVQVLRYEYQVDVDREFASVLYSNLAFTYIKLVSSFI